MPTTLEDYERLRRLMDEAINPGFTGTTRTQPAPPPDPKPAPARDKDPATSACDNCGYICLAGQAVLVTYYGMSKKLRWCPACASAHAATCYRCKDRFAAGQAHGLRFLTGEHGGRGADKYVCHACWTELGPIMWRCPACHIRYENNSVLVKDDNLYYGQACRWCVETARTGYDPERDRTVVHSYSFKPYPIFHGTGRMYGVEVEVDITSPGTYSQSYGELTLEQLGKRRVYLKSDASVSGFEIVSYPHSLEEHQKLWPNFKAPEFMTSHAGGHCGIHVHIERRGLSSLHIGKMLVFVNASENADFIRKVAQRSSTAYNVRAPKKISDVTDNLPEGRRAAVNLTNRPTIEIRIFRGNTRPERILKAIEFCDCLLEFTRNASCRELTAPAFMKFLLAHTRRYPNLIGFLTERRMILACEVCGRLRANLVPKKPATVLLDRPREVCVTCRDHPERAQTTIRLGRDAVARRIPALATSVADN